MYYLLTKSKFILLIILLFVLDACTKETEVLKEADTLTYQEKKAIIKKDAKLFGQALSQIAKDENVVFSDPNALYGNLKSEVHRIGKSPNLEKGFLALEEEYQIKNNDLYNSKLLQSTENKYNDLSENIKKHLGNVNEMIYRQIEFVYDLDNPKKSHEALRMLDNSDSVKIYLKEIETGFIEGLETLEQEVDVDYTITEEEKLKLISNISLAIEVLPTITDEFSVLFTEDISDARFLKRVGNFIKSVVNGVATVVANIINQVAYFGTVGVAFAGISGGAVGLVVGGIAGFISGLEAVVTGGEDGGPYACLFCVYDSPGNPCCCADPDTGAACPL